MRPHAKNQKKNWKLRELWDFLQKIRPRPIFFLFAQNRLQLGQKCIVLGLIFCKQPIFYITNGLVKTWGPRQSGGVIFSGYPALRRLKGRPLQFAKYTYPKKDYHVFYAKFIIIITFARGGLQGPPLGDRVNFKSLLLFLF